MRISGFLLILCLAGILESDAWFWRRNRWRSPKFQWSWTPPKVSGDRIKETADRFIGNTTWSNTSNNGTTRDYSNYFVAQVLKEAGARAPGIRVCSWGGYHCRWYPIGAKRWGNPNYYHLRRNRCWNHVTTTSVGDVISDGQHVGIVTGDRQTTSPNAETVAKNDWGFDANTTVVAWRYSC